MRHKILIPSYDFKPALGGVANYAHELATALQNQGDVDVKVIARAQANDQAFDKQVPYQVQRIASPQTALFSVPVFARAVAREIKNWKPDKIFAPLWFPDGAAVLAARAWSGNKIPYYVAAHGTEVFDNRQNFKNEVRHWLLLDLRRRVLQGAEKIFPVSQFTARALQELHGLHPARVRAVPNGVNTGLFHKQNPTQKFTGTPLLLTVTRLHAYKGVDRVIESLPQLLPQFPQLSYLVVGEGPDRPRLEKLVDALHLQKNVRFLGVLEQKAIVDLYSQADLFVLLSRHAPPDVEGFGLVFLEAAACGLPSLGGRSGGIPDAIEENKSGWLVDPQDPDAIAAHLKEILSSPDKRRSASEYGLNMVREKTWSHVGRRIREEILG